MARISDEDKMARKERIRLIIRHDNGIRESEIVDQVGLGQRTVNNYLRELEHEGKIFKKGVLWYEQDFAETELRRFALSAEETLTFYILVRLFVKQTDKRNEIAEQLLVRLAEVLKNEEIVHADILEASKELAQREEKAGFLRIYRTVLRGYLFRRRLKIKYQPLNGEAFETEMEIYLIEPSSFGYATYLIGFSERHRKEWTYKLERVISAEILPQKYDIPADFPGLDYLRNAWSIYGGNRTVRVKLRFSERVKSRVLESNWHFSQGYEEQGDGSLLWWVDVADTTDIFPWIRQWGGDVEILEPAKLQRAMRIHVRQLMRAYGLTTGEQPYQLLYAKTDRETGQTIHLLLYHLIDVGQVALQLWQTALGAAFRKRIATLLGVHEDAAGNLCAFLAALHDLGKAGPAYQDKYAPDWLRKELRDCGLDLNMAEYGDVTRKQPHGSVSAWCLPPFLVRQCGMTADLAQRIAIAIGGHHGKWPFRREFKLIKDGEAWRDAREKLVAELVSLFRPPVINVALDEEDENALLMLLSGLTSVADWLGSREDSFPFEDRVLPTEVYGRLSAENAKNALNLLGWNGWQPTNQTLGFSQLFAHLAEDGTKVAPRPIQAAVIAQAQTCTEPTLLILEAPTGSGKTEAALYLADTWLQRDSGRGFYIAMPTQATSNQLFDRTVDFLQHRYPDQLVNINLAHSQWRLHETATKRTLDEVQLHEVGKSEKQRVAAMSWFTNKSKRTLLAPFGVGTIDQALLSVLQTRHFFVRLFGLSHKVVIFDEVHAYDTYMLTLLEELLAWLQAVGTSVILLSATLPSETRRRLVRAYSWEKLHQSEPKYPALTIVRVGGEATVTQLPKPDDKPLPLDWLPVTVAAQDKQSELDKKFAKEVVRQLQTALGEGGCAAVICNTVARAQVVYEAICADEQLRKIPAADRILFHARFPVLWRKRDKEDVVLEKFGKPKEGRIRPKTAIVVATQVIEQSLDLDFDIMLTDLAPIDLLLQRAGRLHRHKRENRQHSKRLSIVQTQLADGTPVFGHSEFVYDSYHLLRTYYALQQHPAPLELPSETPTLIEQIYGDLTKMPALTVAVIAQIKAAKTALDEATKRDRGKAKNRVIPPPDAEEMLDTRYAVLEEDDPTVGEAMQAMTRLIPPSITLICLHRVNGTLYLEPEGKQKVTLIEKPSAELTHDLMLRAINVTRREVVQFFQTESAEFPTSPILKHCHLIQFENGEWATPADAPRPFRLRLTRRLGLEFLPMEVA